MRHHITIHPSRHYSQPSRSLNRRKQSFVPTLRRNRSQKALWKVVFIFFALAHAPLMTFRVQRQPRQRLPGGKWHSSGTLERSLLVSPLLSTRTHLPTNGKTLSFASVKGQVWGSSGQATLCDVTKQYDPPPRRVTAVPAKCDFTLFFPRAAP